MAHVTADAHRAVARVPSSSGVVGVSTASVQHSGSRRRATRRHCTSTAAKERRARGRVPCVATKSKAHKAPTVRRILPVRARIEPIPPAPATTTHTPKHIGTHIAHASSRGLLESRVLGWRSGGKEQRNARTQQVAGGKSACAPGCETHTAHGRPSALLQPACSSWNDYRGVWCDEVAASTPGAMAQTHWSRGPSCRRCNCPARGDVVPQTAPHLLLPGAGNRGVRGPRSLGARRRCRCGGMAAVAVYVRGSSVLSLPATRSRLLRCGRRQKQQCCNRGCC